MSTKRGERACAPEPNDNIIWDGVIALKRRQSDSLSADERHDVVQCSGHPSKIGRDVSLMAERPNVQS